MRGWPAERIAAAAGAELVRAHGAGAAGPERVVVDSRSIRPGDLFVALTGTRVDGGRFAADALRAGAWGVLVAPAWVNEATGAGAGAVLAAARPLRSLGALARAWRRELAADVVAVTGSVGKTSTKELTAALIAPHRAVVASRANYNTDIGLPLELLAAPAGTEVLVLELAMRGFGQIAELTAICEPDVGVVTNVGPVHLEQMGSLEGVARAKGELPAGMRDGATAIVPAGERLLSPHLRDVLRVVTFGPGGDVRFADAAHGALGDVEASGSRANGARRGVASASSPPPGVRRTVLAGNESFELELPFSASHNLTNTLAAVAAARAVGVRPEGRVDVSFGALRGERVSVPRGAVILNDCYNANPLSMRAALDELASEPRAERRVAVLGDMLELGAEEHRHHAELGRYASDAGVDLLLAVGPRAAAMRETFAGTSRGAPDAAAAAALAAELVRAGDVVLVKGSRGVGLEVVAEALAGEETPDG